jgi:hypothetical protein
VGSVGERATASVASSHVTHFARLRPARRGERLDAEPRRYSPATVTDQLSRKAFLERSGLAALGAVGVYGAFDSIAAVPARAAGAHKALPPEQHLMEDIRVITSDGVEVNVQPLHHQVVTANLTTGTSRAALADARRALEEALQSIESRYAPSASGLGLVVAWGTPYFRRYVPRVGGKAFPAYLPVDHQASQTAATTVPAFYDTERFPSDPSDVLLERNDLCVVMKSDALAHITDESTALFKALSGLVHITSIRRGFVGGSVAGGPSLPKSLATSAKIGGASLIPETAQLFLGFTSTQRSSQGPDRIANFETLPGLTDQWPNGYFRHGTTLHLSHLYEHVEEWYQVNSFPIRVWLATDLSRNANFIDENTLTLPEGPADVQTEQLVEQFATDPTNGLVGHSASMQPVNRLPSAVRDNYGVERPAGTAILQRVDFNTLDNPFQFTSRPRVDRLSDTPSAGLHFLAYAPTSDFFRRMRLAMDGRYADGVSLPIPPRSPAMGLNGVLRTTHRQHFLVPPRAHRSFPLSELL